MRDNWLSNRIFKSYEDIVALCCQAWNNHDIEISRDVRLDEVEEFAELSGPMARETFGRSRGDVEGREERGRAVALVVAAPACPGRARWAGNGPGPSTQRTRGSGGAKYRPTMSRTF